MDSKVKKQIIDKIRDSNNVLVALNSNPSVDELSAALGVTLSINKIDKHATAVFSGDIPAAIEFLEPQKTFENSVLSLQDFIIALDKEKADHLRYKVEGDMVKIFITPYRTTIDEGDLEFSQGDYNVDFVLAIGVQDANNLDRALASHGQILEDATVASISLNSESTLGTINWNDTNSSSYCEIATNLVKDLRSDKDVFDEQIATALLTGIVAATDRFSNEKTSSRAMTIAAELMSAGANQQLISVQLEQAEEISQPPQPPQVAQQAEPIPENSQATEPTQPQQHAGELSIHHELRGDLDEVANQVAEEHQAQAAREAESELSRQLHPTYEPMLPPVQPAIDYEETPVGGKAFTQQAQNEPSFGGTLNATTEEAADDSRREQERDQNRTILSHGGGHYMNEQPAFQAPLSASASAPNGDEPEVRDIFSDNGAAQLNAPSIHDLHGAPAGDSVSPHATQVSTLPPLPVYQPPAEPMQSISTEPTLADIDKENRSHGALLGDVHAAFNGVPSQQAPSPNGLPPLPPLPPLPDMSTLPPFPGQASTLPSFPANPFNNAPTIQAEPLGNTLPPAPNQSVPGKADPGQFKIPGAP